MQYSQYKPPHLILYATCDIAYISCLHIIKYYFTNVYNTQIAKPFLEERCWWIETMSVPMRIKKGPSHVLCWPINFSISLSHTHSVCMCVLSMLGAYVYMNGLFLSEKFGCRAFFLCRDSFFSLPCNLNQKVPLFATFSPAMTISPTFYSYGPSLFSFLLIYPSFS